MVDIHIDGSYLEKIDSVGYGVYVIDGNITYKDCGKVRIKNTKERNIIGEVYASIRALQLCIANDYKEINLYYDYQGIEKWVTGEWKAKKPLTQRYVEVFNNYLQTYNIKVNFHHVKGHTGIEGNEIVDKLAKLGTLL